MPAPTRLFPAPSPTGHYPSSPPVPEAKRRPFVEASTSRIGGFLQDHKNALIGAGVGWLVGKVILSRIPVVNWFVGGKTGAIIGAWIGHAKDKEERQKRQAIASIVADELKKANA